MEWEAILVRFPDQLGIENIPKDWQPPSLGSSAEVKSRLEEVFPDKEHLDGHSTVKMHDLQVEFDYGLFESTDEPVRAIHTRSTPEVEAIPILKLASESFGCRLFDLQAGEFADFGERTEASMRDCADLCRQVKREKRWAFGIVVIVVATFHALQDSGVIPAIQSLSKPATAGYGIIGLIFLNAIVFSLTVIGAIRQVGQLKGEAESTEEQEKLEEAILVPAFQGQGIPPSLVSRYLHIPIAGLLGMIAGAILAGVISLIFF